ncbi:MAG: CoxG family protein [Janthinobacterium lividum]
MEITGERRVPSPRSKVWASLNDAQVLRACLPGVQSLEQVSPTEFRARSEARVGPVSTPVAWTVRRTAAEEMTSATWALDGKAGEHGSLSGTATVRLADQGEFTLLSHTASVTPSGRVAQLGERALDAAAGTALGGFLDRFTAEVSGVPEYGADGILAGGLEKLADLRPGPRAPALVNALAMIPAAPLGFPLVFWMGSAAFFVVVLLVFGFI